MSLLCIRLPDCLPCAFPRADQSQIIEKLEVEKVAVTLFSEGKISESELDRIVASDKVYIEELRPRFYYSSLSTLSIKTLNST